MNVDDELASRWLGRTINNKYVVQSVVGNGGMAVVYSVKHRNGKRFALKMLHRELSLNQLIRQRFVREGYVANRVEHDGAVAVIDDDITEDGSAFLVMELLQGVTLERLWEANGQRLTLECVLAIAERLLDVLAAAHLQNIVHRDLKPANIFVTRHGVVKILDFGIARLREGDGNKTETGTTLGTPLFMPPEQASGRSRDVDARTDLWAVGATMFSLLSGQYVHDGENSAQVLIAVATTPAKSLSAVVPDAPPEVVAIVDKALAFHNDDRWESAIAMRAAILEAQTKLNLPVANEFLARIVRATAPGTGSDVQSTPATTPAPVDRTERIPATPPNPWHSDVPLISLGPSGIQEPRPSATPEPRPSAMPDGRPPQDGDTKLSAVAPENLPEQNGKRSELAESSARAMTSPTVTPPARSKSRVGAILLAVAACAVAAIFVVRLGGPEHVPAASVAAPPPTPVAAPPPAPTPAAPPAVVASAPSAPSPAEVASAEANNTPPTVSVVPGHPLAAAAPVRGARRPVAAPKGAKTPAGSSASAAPAPPAPTPAATPAPAPTPAATPAPTPTPANGRKAPPTLDRSSPF